jgi:hypothetical protein
MKKLPKTENSLLLRTDFTDEATWARLCEAVQLPGEEGFRAYVDCISDPAYDGLTVKQLLRIAPKEGDHSFVFIVDRIALTHPEHPILVVDFHVPACPLHAAGRPVRAVDGDSG